MRGLNTRTEATCSIYNHRELDQKWFHVGTRADHNPHGPTVWFYGPNGSSSYYRINKEKICVD